MGWTKFHKLVIELDFHHTTTQPQLRRGNFLVDVKGQVGRLTGDHRKETGTQTTTGFNQDLQNLNKQHPQPRMYVNTQRPLHY